MSPGAQTLIFSDHEFSDINVGEATAAELLSVIRCVLATAGALYDKRMKIAEELVSRDLDI
jgi:hypothetical protein